MDFLARLILYKDIDWAYARGGGGGGDFILIWVWTRLWDFKKLTLTYHNFWRDKFSDNLWIEVDYNTYCP